MTVLIDFTEIREILRCVRVVAVVGLSPKPVRPSYQVASYLLKAGYRVIPVNPGQSSILGQTCYPDLASVPHKIDLVDIFRRSRDVLPVVEQAVAVGAGVIWMQQGIVNEEAASLARKAGLRVVMDRCLSEDHRHLFPGKN